MDENKGAGNITLVSKSLAQHPDARQNEADNRTGIVQPPISFYALGLSYDNSFILWGIFDKLATAANTGFTETKNKELDALLASIDLKLAFENILVYGNFFIEKVLGGKGQIIELVPFLTETIRVWNLGGEFGYVQNINGQEAFFLQQDIIHAKTASVRNRYYGESRFGKSVRQIVLLSKIDEYYNNMFDRGMLDPAILIDKGNRAGATLGDTQREALGAWLRDSAAGTNNAFSTAIIPTELEKLELSSTTDTEAFLKYRDKLINSIAIGLNIPVELLMPDNSNRATAEVAFNSLNDLIVKPMQKAFLQDIKNGLRDKFGNDVEKIEIILSNTDKRELEMKIYTGWVKGGIMTPNEARVRVPEENLQAIADGDKLQQTKSDPTTDAMSIAKDIQDLQKSLQPIYE